MRKIENHEDLERIRSEIIKKRDAKKTCITISSGTCGHIKGSQKVAEAFISEIKRRRLEKIAKIKVKAKDVEKIISETIINKRIVNRLLYKDPAGKKFISAEEIPFYKKQMRVLLNTNWLIDPTKIEDYLAIGGYSALVKIFSDMSSQEVIDIIKQSGLRGRGGAGFPTGVKWENCRNAKGDIKYVVCNADEGDPGAYMDRSLLEGNPHSIIEGMIIGGYAIGAREGYVYVRHEYPLAVKNLSIALNQVEECGLLGNDILGSGFDFNIKISHGGGAFVCGESTALMASIEGKMGEPRAKYVHTVEKGLWNKPTCLNNVETWANIPTIINKGTEWFSSIGTDKSKGTKIFSLVGKVKNTGLVEVPMGITLREIIYEIGGGVPNGKRFKAVQTGGPSGGCIPEELLDLPVDFEKLTEVGSMMGSGGMIVMDEDTCVVDVAKYFLNFLLDESCGKCIPCREGIENMLEIVERTTQGRGKDDDMELLEKLASLVKDFSLCGLGQTAPNPVLSTIRYFKNEWESHIKEKGCPAHFCKELTKYLIDIEKCTGCGVCRNLCSQNAILGKAKESHSIIQEKCTSCGVCREYCNFNAVIVKSPRGVN